MISIDVEHNGVPLHMEQAEAAIPIFVDKMTGHASDALESFAPVRTGQLKSSFYGVVDGIEAAIWSSSQHAEWLEKGTGTFGPNKSPIVPTDSYALKFAWDKMGGAMTVWRGDLGNVGKGEFLSWGESIGAIPFVVWPRGMEPDTEYIDQAVNSAESEAEETLDQSLDQSGAT